MTKNKKYRCYACYKNSRGDGECIEKDSMTEAYAALKQFECYFQDDLIFIGVIKCAGNNPLGHICHLS